MIADWCEERREMVEGQLRKRGISDARVLDVMARLPREQFVPLEQRAFAYSDAPAPIGAGQTLSQPVMTALMAAALELAGPENVLEVGGGCGYAAALLGQLAARVTSVELIPELAAAAAATLRRLGLDSNVTVECGDGSLGWPEAAPYDAISVAAGAPYVPPALLEQLREGGRLVMPVGPEEEQELRLFHKSAGKVTYQIVSHCRFVPLRGAAGVQ